MLLFSECTLCLYKPANVNDFENNPDINHSSGVAYVGDRAF